MFSSSCSSDVTLTASLYGSRVWCSVRGPNPQPVARIIAARHSARAARRRIPRPTIKQYRPARGRPARILPVGAVDRPALGVCDEGRRPPMLDLDHPQTPDVFAASWQLDLIHNCCKRATLTGTSGRRLMLGVVRPAFAALRWLAEHRFSDQPGLADGIDQLERQVEQLAALPLREPDPAGRPVSRCPSCGGTPTVPHRYDRISCCTRCLAVVLPGLRRLRSCEDGFGTDAI